MFTFDHITPINPNADMREVAKRLAVQVEPASKAHWRKMMTRIVLFGDSCYIGEQAIDHQFLGESDFCLCADGRTCEYHMRLHQGEPGDGRK